jgi:ABC-type dipeptide/oligopeptide/nickel transport system ATPase component
VTSVIAPREPLMSIQPNGAILNVSNLHTYFYSRGGVAKTLQGVSFHVAPCEVLGLVGQTGSGKSLTAASILGLVQPPGKVVAGSVLFHGVDLLKVSERERQAIRGREIALIVQNPKAALNPVMSVGTQVLNIYRFHMKLPKQYVWKHMLEVFRSVGFDEPERLAASFPYQLSGGMAQRVLIAVMLGLSPKFVIADEPTTGLDATVQVQVLDLLKAKLRDLGAAAILITHDLHIVANYCDRIAVMHEGKIVESAPIEAFFDRPAHPYSQRLLAAQADLIPPE